MVKSAIHLKTFFMCFIHTVSEKNVHMTNCVAMPGVWLSNRNYGPWSQLELCSYIQFVWSFVFSLPLSFSAVRPISFECCCVEMCTQIVLVNLFMVDSMSGMALITNVWTRQCQGLFGSLYKTRSCDRTAMADRKWALLQHKWNEK